MSLMQTYREQAEYEDEEPNVCDVTIPVFPPTSHI